MLDLVHTCMYNVRLRSTYTDTNMYAHVLYIILRYTYIIITCMYMYSSIYVCVDAGVHIYACESGFHPKKCWGGGGEAASSANCSIAATHV